MRRFQVIRMRILSTYSGTMFRLRTHRVLSSRWLALRNYSEALACPAASNPATAMPYLPPKVFIGPMLGWIRTREQPIMALAEQGKDEEASKMLMGDPAITPAYYNAVKLMREGITPLALRSDTLLVATDTGLAVPTNSQLVAFAKDEVLEHLHKVLNIPPRALPSAAGHL